MKALVQASVDQQNQLAAFFNLFDVDFAVGDQQDKIGAWVGVSRKLNRTINVTSFQVISLNFGGQMDQNPLDPTNWSVTGGGFGALQVIGGKCEAASLLQVAAETFIGVALPNDQYCEITVGGVSAVGEISAAARQTGTDGYYADVIGPLGAGAQIVLIRSVGVTETQLGATFTGTVNPGDRVRIRAVGTSIIVSLNGADIITVTDATFASGTIGIGVDETVDLDETFINAFGAGEAFAAPTPISSLPDDAYRILLKLFIAMNAWDGNVPGMYSIWNTVFAVQGYKIYVQDNEDMTMFIVFIDLPTDPVILAILTQGYFLLRPAGVLIIGFFQPSTGFPLFGFDAENATVSGFDVGAWVIPIVV